MKKIETIIGLEVHIELSTESKMFCSCSSQYFGAQPNSHTCPTCLGLPGALPFPNIKAIESAIQVGLALNCQINEKSKFDRKNYFYPDLAKGYQISQYDQPLAVNGLWRMADGQEIRIRRVHQEEDTGKLSHIGADTLIDYNRSGVPLIEIVTEPDFTSSESVRMFLQELQQLIRDLHVSEADMEKGQMRCEPNLNLKITDGDEIHYTPITEIKNINSFKFAADAVEYEIIRQQEEFESTGIEKKAGNKVTRGWNEAKKATVPQRTKEEAEDYRYFPEPDIPPMNFSQEEIAALKDKLPEMAHTRRARFATDYEIPENYVQILTGSAKMADYFEKAVDLGKGKGITAAQIANYLINKKIDITSFSQDSLISAILSQKDKVEIGKEEIEAIIETVISENKGAVTDFQNGKATALEFLVGQVLRISKGQANANFTRELLLAKLK